ncbi:RTA1 like protein-domain-containing protein [Mycena amicta]|nr:RTA1 like protein-domain-containing protein [Mycena amicta]
MASILLPLLIRDDTASANTTVSNDESQYGYDPSETIAILFVALFGISTALHVGQAAYFRTWWLLPTAALCGVGELVGWGARLWSAISPEADTPFLMQISATIIAPTPLLAASFMIFSRIVQQLGVGYSFLPVRWYAWIFMSCDVVALVIQGLGGGLASAADTLDGANRGADIMLGGIGFQFGVIVIFSILVTDFLIRYLRDAPWRRTSSKYTSIQPLVTRGTLTTRIKIVLSALCFSNVVLFIRSVYRIIELVGGWNGRIIHTQVYFDVLDGGMIVLAIFTWNFIHPGMFLLLPKQVAEAKGLDMESRETTVV